MLQKFSCIFEAVCIPIFFAHNENTENSFVHLYYQTISSEIQRYICTHYTYFACSNWKVAMFQANLCGSKLSCSNELWWFHRFLSSLVSKPTHHTQIRATLPLTAYVLSFHRFYPTRQPLNFWSYFNSPSQSQENFSHWSTVSKTNLIHNQESKDTKKIIDRNIFANFVLETKPQTEVSCACCASFHR